MIRRIDPRNINLTYEQVREFMGDSPVYNARTGNTITWRCNWVDTDTWKPCPYQFIEEVTEDKDVVAWPHALIEHVWKEGHLSITSNDGRTAGNLVYSPRPSYRPSKVTIFLGGYAIGFTIMLIFMAVIR